MEHIVIRKNRAFPVIVILAVFAVVFALLVGENPPWGVWAAVVLAPPVIIFYMLANRYVKLDPKTRTASLPFLLFFRHATPWDGVRKKVRKDVVEDHGHEKTVYELVVSGPFPEAVDLLEDQEEYEQWAAMDDVEVEQPDSEASEQEAA